jgi:hypothetical protein
MKSFNLLPYSQVVFIRYFVVSFDELVDSYFVEVPVVVNYKRKPYFQASPAVFLLYLLY